MTISTFRFGPYPQWSRALAAGVCAVSACFSLSYADVGSETTPPDVVEQQQHEVPARPHPREKTFMKRQWGVEVLFLRQTSAGYMLEFRYKVLDPEKAAPLFDRQTKPILTHVSSGAKLIVPTPAKTGALRNSNPPLADHTYWMFFANPGKLVQPGDTVNIEIGDFLVKDLVVQ